MGVGNEVGKNLSVASKLGARWDYHIKHQLKNLCTQITDGAKQKKNFNTAKGIQTEFWPTWWLNNMVKG